MYRRILVPLDGSRFGDHALPYAVEIARSTGAALELVHVHQHEELDPDLAAMPQYQFQHVNDADLEHDDACLKSEISDLEQKAADLELRYDVQVTTRILSGNTGSAVLREALDVVADLIVMSTHARQGLARLRYGSVAHELISQLNVPALCVRPVDGSAPPVAPSLKRFLIALDGSHFSEQVLDVLAPLMTMLRAQPTLLHVVASRALLSSGVTDDGRILLNRDQALGYLNEVAERYRGRMPDPVLAALEHGVAARLIGGLLAAGEYDVVAMATHGRSGLSRLFVGSVAEEVLQTTDRPVLLYRPRIARLPTGNLADAFRIYGDPRDF
jgi:nucleotide-binding universal stress UspA family protein